MSFFTMITVVMALLGSALIGGIFFAFSSFVMKALARLPSPQGMAAMQSINVVVLNPLFLIVFTGTALLSLLVSILAIKGWEAISAPYFLIGALLYLCGTFLVTGVGNVPLNNQLAAATPTDPASGDLWEHYLDRWTWLNTLRTVSAMAAALFLIMGLIKS
ncbi:MAG: DUF1772 domain-containing protein [Gammaproteobacteria bacterium]|jgi:uncharacterized membrane protein